MPFTYEYPRPALTVDCVAAEIMGFEWQKLPLLKNAFRIRELSLSPFLAEDIEVVSNRTQWNQPLVQIQSEDTFHFRPHFGWIGAIERQTVTVAS